MSFIAILGAGALGGTLAHRLASRGRVSEVRLIDEQASVAQGKALDIQQSGAVEGFCTRLTSAGAIAAAAGADAIVIADAAQGDVEHSGEAGLALVKRVASMEAAAPLIFAGAAQRLLLARAATELHLPPRRLLGTAPGALESALRALAGLEADAIRGRSAVARRRCAARRGRCGMGRSHCLRPADLDGAPAAPDRSSLLTTAAALAAGTRRPRISSGSCGRGPDGRLTPSLFVLCRD